MKARTLIRFTDLKEDKVREIGEEFVLSKERFDEILSKGRLIEEVEEVKVGAGGRKKRTKNN